MNAPVRIRHATAADIPALCSLLDMLFSIEADFEPDRGRQQRGLELLLARGEAACVLVAEAKGQVVGLSTAQVLISTAEGGPVAIVEDVVVGTESRGFGIGTRLIESMEAWAREQGLTRLQLLADRNNRLAHQFYARHGWHPTQLTAWRKTLRAE